MTIKEFAHKHSLTFLWSTIVLAIIILLMLAFGSKRKDFENRRGFGDRDFERRGGPMMNRGPAGYTGQTEQIPQEEQVLPIDNTDPSQTQ